MTPKTINDSKNFASFSNLLKEAKLPHEDLNMDDHILINYFDEDKLIGTGGIEIYGDYGLIRSVSIVASSRGKKLGSKIASHLIDKAKENNLKSLYLLTETARDFFLKIGFVVVDRDQVPEIVKVSSEFSHVCPASAVCMRLDLNK